MKAPPVISTAARILLLLMLFVSACSSEPGADLDSPAAPDSTLPEPMLSDSLSQIQMLADSIRTVNAAQSGADTTDVALLATAVASLAESIDAYNRLNENSDSLGDVTLDEAGQAVQHYGMRVFWALLVLIAAYFFVRGLTFVLDKISELNAERRLFYKRLVPIARVLVWTVTLYFIVRVIFRVDNQSLLAAAAAVGVAIGFAAQDIVKNIFGGFVIISDRPFQVGDKITVGGVYGEVTAIGLRSTRLVTPDDNVVSVPNAQVVSNQVSNANAGALDCQVVTDLYLPGWVDESEAKRIAYQAAASSKYVFLKKPIVVIVKDEFKETFITHIKVKAYVLDTRYEFLLMSDITERARKAFREAGLLMPMHGAKAYVDLTSVPYTQPAAEGGSRGYE